VNRKERDVTERKQATEEVCGTGRKQSAKEVCAAGEKTMAEEHYSRKGNRSQVNYQKELEKVLDRLKEEARVPTLFLHSCCAPCSSYVLEYLCAFFQITVFYFNPNISDSAEYKKRVEEQKRLIGVYNQEQRGYPIAVLEGAYEPRCFFEATKGLETCPEGGERCFRCYELRLRETAKRAAESGSNYFATTLTISPLKNACKLNEIGQALSKEYGVPWLPSDFKKKDGYKRSIELSAQYGLYRQNYCGCVFSRREERGGQDEVQ